MSNNLPIRYCIRTGHPCCFKDDGTCGECGFTWEGYDNKAQTTDMDLAEVSSDD